MENGTITGLVGAAFVFGMAFNWLVGTLNRRGWSDGYISLLVVFGTIATLVLTIPVIGTSNAIVVGVFFACTGFPMIIGDIYRHIQKRDQDMKDLLKVLND